MFPDTELNDKLPPAKVFVIIPLALNVVNAPVLAVVAPIAVEFRPVEVKEPRFVPATEMSTPTEPYMVAAYAVVPNVEPVESSMPK